MTLNTTVPLFLHIPKCGGSTITHVIYNQCRTDQPDKNKRSYWHRGVYFYPKGLEAQTDSTLPSRVVEMLGRLDLTAVVGHFSFGIHHHLNKPFSYTTVVREPISRLLSLYDELKLQGRIDMDLEEFINSTEYAGVENDQTRRLAGECCRSQKCDESVLSRAKKNLKAHFAVVGVTDRIDETLCLMHRRFGWSEPLAYYPKNITLHRTPIDSVAADLRAEIADHQRFDRELYDFAGRLLQEAITKEGSTFLDEVAQYKESVKVLIDQVDSETIESEDSKRVHQLVVEMIRDGGHR